MSSTIIIYLIIVCLATLLSSFLSIFGLLRFRNAPGGRFYIIVTALSAFLTFSYAMEIYSVTYEGMRFWLRMEYIALPLLPVFILLMAVEYCGHKIKLWMSCLVLIIPVITIIMQNTNELHYMYYTSMGVLVNSPFSVIYLQHGPFYMLHTVFFYSCVCISIVLLVLQLRKLVKPFRKQTYLMIVGLIVPGIGGFLNIVNNGAGSIDMVPVFMSLSFVFHGLALTSLRMFDVAPIARDIVFESIEQGVLVLNDNDIIIDYNTSFTSLPLDVTDTLIGHSIQKVLSRHKDLIAVVEQGEECDFSLQLKEQLISLHIRFSPVTDKNSYHAGTVVTFLDVTERVAMEETLKHMASTDGLTQIYNRTFFSEQVQNSLTLPQAPPGQAALILFDIDFFKEVNDTYGHDAGDQVLMSIARVIKSSLRPSDIAGRYGGEEFIMYMPGAPKAEAVETAHTLRLGIEKHIIRTDNIDIQVTSSFGVAHTVLEEPVNGAQVLSDLTKNADLALYEAKQGGRNCVRVFKHPQPVSAGSR